MKGTEYNILHCLSTSFSEYVIRIVQENLTGLKLKVTHHIRVFAGVNLLSKTIITINKHTGTQLYGGKKVGLEANTEKTKYYIFMHRHRL
jgi:hypothetical protein